MIEVVNAVIVRSGRILLTQRRADKDFAFTFECPGGKVEGDHENHHSALRRELKEEIGIEVDAIREQPIFYRRFQNPVSRADRADVLVLLYMVMGFAGTPAPKEGQGLAWFKAWEFRHLTLAPAAYAARDELERLISLSSAQ